MKADASPIRRVLAGLGVEYQQGRTQYSARCPAHKDGNASLAVSVDDSGTVALHCHAGCSIDAVCSALGMTTADLFPGKVATKPKAKAATKPRAKIPKPATVEPLTADQWAEAEQAAKSLYGSGFTGLKLVAVYPYRLANGQVHGWRARFIDKAGEKHIKPFHRNGQEWVPREPKPPRAGKPLYRLPEVLAAEGVIVVVEGEKCADALAVLGVAATTSGAAKSAAKADWSPLAGRACVIWPDNDDPGEQYAADVAKILQELGCDVRIIDVDALGLDEIGADAVDWLDANPTATAADMLALPTVAPKESGVQLLRASDIQPKAIDWAWQGYLARRMLTLIAGNGGTGKTTLALSLAATISRGGKWPDGTTAPVGNVIIWSGEDAIAEVLVPRLREAGADMARIHFVGNGDQVFDPATDMPALEHAACRITDLALVIVDPIVSMVQGDSHKNAEVRRGLQPLLNLAADTGAAVVGITHYAKNTAGRSTAERVIGSVAFNAVARVTLATAMGSDGEGRIVRAKNNVGLTGDGFAYSIAVVDREIAGQRSQVSKIEWGRPLYGFADELLGQIESKRQPKDEAAEWLAAMLHGGPVASKELKVKADADGIAWRTVERAKEALDVVAVRQGEPGKRGAGAWTWKLPSNKAIKA
ncbi:AAA family ATPase [Luteimonas viscosa]|uniref:AAA family ATPase n=1 Tax=Luteimonas viscosa TaxID=1132694 RepID=A0A5D4XRD6_9GAMM|nr:AAA family ATPase [Luteimonas viscosa]TYT27258.1 AAA family ATPase [Luteimonas viscosa]